MPRHGVYPRDVIPPRSRYSDEGRFGRMFGKLPPFAADTPDVRAALLEIGKLGGIMDAKDNLRKSPKDLITRPTLQVRNSDNPNLTAGFTFLGQFIDHDITFDPTSSLEGRAAVRICTTCSVVRAANCCWSQWVRPASGTCPATRRTWR